MVAAVRTPSNEPAIESLLPASRAVTEPVPVILARMLRSMATVERRALNVSSLEAATERPNETKYTAIDNRIQCPRPNDYTALRVYCGFKSIVRSKTSRGRRKTLPGILNAGRALNSAAAPAHRAGWDPQCVSPARENLEYLCRRPALASSP